MSDVWIITRSLTNEMASNITVDDAIKNDYSMTEDESYGRERFCESLKIKAGLDSLGINFEFKRARDLVSPGYLTCAKKLPKVAFDGFPAWDHLHNHIDNLYALKQLGVKVINDPAIHLVCTDKWKYQQILEKNNIPSIQSMTASLPITDESIRLIEATIGYPVVIKPTCDAIGRGIMKCHNADDVWDACLKISKLKSKSKAKNIIIQKWMDHNINGAIRVHMIGGNIVACSHRRPIIEMDFFYSGLAENSIRTEYKITPKLAEYCRSIYLALDNIDIFTMDILHDGTNYVACDINSPGTFVGLDMFLNTNIGKLIAEYLASKL